MLVIYMAIYMLVSVPDPKPTPAQIAFSIACVILEAIYTPERSGDETIYTHV